MMGNTTLSKALADYVTIYMAYRNFAERTRVEYQNDLEDLGRFLRQSHYRTIASNRNQAFRAYTAHFK